jgi:GT2 family glycosyltransferase
VNLQTARLFVQRPDVEAQVASPTFSVVIPTYNEEGDISATLERVISQSVAPVDVIVVDGGSLDGTLEQLRRWARDERVAVIEEGRRRGVAAARNAGIRAATGDVVVILNADVLLPADFLERLAPLYRGDADLVSVESRVDNQESFTGRYVHATHLLKYGEKTVGWSEGFSCRRDAALAAGFPEEIPGAGGEDVEFVERLLAAGCRWKVDYSIVVAHRVPETLGGFWQQFRGRGHAVPYTEHRLKSRPLASVTLRRALVTLWSLAVAAAVVPNAVMAVRLSRRSSRGWRDVPAFWLAHHTLIAAHRLGEWESLRQLWRARRAAA